VTPPRIGIATVVKFVLVCFAVGWVLTFLAIRPKEIWHWLVETVQRFGHIIVDIGSWALPYILVGAGVVVPIIAIRWIYRNMKGR